MENNKECRSRKCVTKNPDFTGNTVPAIPSGPASSLGLCPHCVAAVKSAAEAAGVNVGQFIADVVPTFAAKMLIRQQAEEQGGDEKSEVEK